MSTRFMDGPAKGKSLTLRHAPIVLRVVVNAKGTVDALDKLDDTVATDEKCYAYIQIKGTISRWDQRTSEPETSGFFEGADYRLCKQQPPDEVLRDNDRWRAWCQQNREALMKSFKEYES